MFKTKEKNRKLRFFAFCIAALIFFAFFQSPRTLIDIEKGMPAVDVELVYPVSSFVFAPFLDFPSYFLTLANPRIQLISWFSWISIFMLFFSLARRKGNLFRRLLFFFRRTATAAVLFSLFIIYSILCPLPQYTLKSKRSGEIFLDLHSHTVYSHDGLVTPERSLKWHIDSGFKAWALTEHDWIGKAPLIQNGLIGEKSGDAFAITAQESGFKGGHLNLLGLKEDFQFSSTDDLVSLVESAHLKRAAVVVPHHWAAVKSPVTMEDLYEAGVDGFEIAGNASVPLTPGKQKEIILFCREKGLVMVSGTNWHGWRNFCTVWTGFEAGSWKSLDNEGRERLIINALINREDSKFRVIGYPQKVLSPVHYFFEPFSGLFSYFSSLTRGHLASWFLWGVAVFFFLRIKRGRRMVPFFFWLAAGLILLAKRASLLETWASVSAVNEILPEVAQALLSMAIITFFFAATNLKGIRRGR